jgi:hypothetical protein
MDQAKLAAILTDHSLWRLTGGAGGSRANLYGANLYVSHFWKWLVNANSREMAIGCQRHDWATWKAKGPALAREHGGAECEKQFRQMWPVLDAARKMLQKRFPAKKATAKKEA